MNRVAVHFSPHPDDELLGAPGALFALRDAGWRVVNVACSLGRAEHRERRLAELEEACARARFELRLEHTEPAAVLAELAPGIVVAPSPHDRHPFHEEVSRSVLREVAGSPALVWLWSLWGESPLATLAVELTEERLGEIGHALAAHAGELERTDFRRLLEARAAVDAVTGAERLFGFRAESLPFRYAELLTELRAESGRFRLCEPRILGDPPDPEGGHATGPDVSEWLFEPSVTTRFGSRHRD